MLRLRWRLERRLLCRVLRLGLTRTGRATGLILDLILTRSFLLLSGLALLLSWSLSLLLRSRLLHRFEDISPNLLEHPRLLIYLLPELLDLWLIVRLHCFLQSGFERTELGFHRAKTFGKLRLRESKQCAEDGSIVRGSGRTGGGVGLVCVGGWCGRWRLIGLRRC